MIKEVMGESPETKVLMYFCAWRNDDIVINDLVKNSKVSRTRAYDLVKKYHRMGIIKVNAKLGATSTWRINKENPMAKDLIRLYRSIIKHFPEAFKGLVE